MMRKRFLSLWFPYLGIEHIFRSKSDFNKASYVTVTKNNNLFFISSVSLFAKNKGLYIGQSLNDAQILCPNLQIKEADIFIENRFLKNLQRWAEKFSPLVSIDGKAGLILDITGCGNLFGGENSLINKIEQDCIDMKLTVIIGAADTIGAAWALAHYEDSNSQSYRNGDLIDQEARATRSRSFKRRIGARLMCDSVNTIFSSNKRIAKPGEVDNVLNALPISLLRLSQKEVSELVQLGISNVKELEALPRGPLERRFGLSVLKRLDQAFGRCSEPISNIEPNIYFSVRMTFPEPIELQNDILAATERLLTSLGEKVSKNGNIIKRLQLHFYLINHEEKIIEVNLSQATVSMEKILNLFKLQIEKLNLFFGVDRMRIYVSEIEPLNLKQKDISLDSKVALNFNMKIDTLFHDLITRIGVRIGLNRIIRLGPADSNIPEKTANVFSVAWSKPIMEWPMSFLSRPIHIFQPEPIIPICLQHTLKTFRWRSVDFEIIHARGPERIAPEWWLDDKNWRTGVRDYWKVITNRGETLWIYKAHGGVVPGEWFCHGNFG